MTHVLVVEPDVDRRKALTAALVDAGYEVTAVSDVDAGFAPLGHANVVVCNSVLPSGSGLRLLQWATQAPVILTAAHHSVRAAVAAIKSGAANYLVHPLDPAELVGTVQRELASRTPAHMRRSAHGTFRDAPLVGNCSAMSALNERLHAIARLDSPVLIVGEVGTGKESVARALHAASERRTLPLLALNCARVPSDLLAAELFGIAPGWTDESPQGRAGLIESADRGTLYIDDVADLPLDVQAALLQVIETGMVRRAGAAAAREVDVRLIAATRRNLHASSESGRLHEGLRRRLSGIALHLPALRDRGDDLVELSQVLLERTCARLRRPEPVWSDAALRAILDYSWPGNVRELENAIERAVIVNEDGTIAAQDLGIELTGARATKPTPQAEDATTLEDYFVRFVTEHEDTLTETELAQKLGISRKSLWERRQRLNIPRRRTHQRGPRRDD